MKNTPDTKQDMINRLPLWNAMIGFPDRSPGSHPINYPQVTYQQKQQLAERGRVTRSRAFMGIFRWIQQKLTVAIDKHTDRKWENRNRARLSSMGDTALKDISAVITTTGKRTIDLECCAANQIGFNRCA